MDKKIDLIMSSIQQTCRAGYLLPKERQTLSALAELHGIDKAELEIVLNRELEKVRTGNLENLYKAAKQPDAALSDQPALFLQSRRQFPDMIKLGTLKLKLNHDITAPAFVPLKGKAGLCVIHMDQAEIACNIIQNVAMRLMLSIPRSLARITIVDPVSMGADYIGLSGIDDNLLKVIDDEKQVQSFLQGLSRESASFNFNELGSTFADIAEYNRTNRSKAHPYQIVVMSDFQNITDKNIFAEIKKINKLATKTGIFFLFAVEEQKLKNVPELLDVFKTRPEEQPNLCVINTVNKELRAEVNDEEAFFNNAFDFEMDENLGFTSETILKLNHEYAPDRYPIGPIQPGGDDYCIEAVNVVVGKYVNKDNAYAIALQQMHDNILCVSLDDKKVEAIAIGMLRGMTTKYKRSELDFAFYNCIFIPESLSATNIVANIHADKMQYLQSLLKHIEQEAQRRKALFQDAKAVGYENYRNLVETPLPRLVCMIGGIDTILDSESMSAVESLMLLDHLMEEAGQYGIHFILLGKPSANMFKLNLANHVRFKLFGSMNEDETMRIGIFVTENDLRHQNQPNGSVIYDGEKDLSMILELPNAGADALKEALHAFAAEGSPISQPKVYVDLNDVYPQTYRGINADTISDACFASDIPIGIPRNFDGRFATLGLNHVMVVGNDPDGEQSILRSVFAAMKRTGRLKKLSVYDAKESHPLGLSGMPGVKICTDLDSLVMEDGDIVCLLHMEALDTASASKLDPLIDRAQGSNAQLLLFAKNNVDISRLGMVGVTFNMRIALCNAPEGFISPVHFFANNEISLPVAPLQALCEQTDSTGGTEIKAMWLFNY